MLPGAKEIYECRLILCLLFSTVKYFHDNLVKDGLSCQLSQQSNKGAAESILLSVHIQSKTKHIMCSDWLK